MAQVFLCTHKKKKRGFTFWLTWKLETGVMFSIRSLSVFNQVPQKKKRKVSFCLKLISLSSWYLSNYPDRLQPFFAFFEYWWRPTPKANFIYFLPFSVRTMKINSKLQRRKSLLLDIFWIGFILLGVLLSVVALIDTAHASNTATAGAVLICSNKHQQLKEINAWKLNLQSWSSMRLSYALWLWS